MPRFLPKQRNANAPTQSIGLATILFWLVAVSLAVGSLRTNKSTLDLSKLLLQTRTLEQILIAQTDAVLPKEEPYYKAAPVEEYIFNHLEELQLHHTLPQLSPTCHLFQNSSTTPYYEKLHTYLKELEQYYNALEMFQVPEITDLRHHLHHDDNDNDNNKNVCEKLKLHPNGIAGMFQESQQLSYTRGGWVEPILPTLRHPKICFEFKEYLLNTQYMIHDFQALCQKLKPTSRTVFVDMGASLSYHKDKPEKLDSPVIDLLDLYRKFGIQFDHIYAYELTKQDPTQAYEKVPNHLYAAYHWINVGVSSDMTNKHNPFRLLLDHYNKDDLIVVKLDVDTPVLERQLVDQFLNDSRLTDLVDHFYFEHHVNQQEMFRTWGGARHVKESVEETLTLFRGLRQKGVAAHYWV